MAREIEFDGARERPGRLMAYVGILWLGIGLLVGVPMFYSSYNAGGGECAPPANPTSFGLPSDPTALTRMRGLSPSLANHQIGTPCPIQTPSKKGQRSQQSPATIASPSSTAGAQGPASGPVQFGMYRPTELSSSLVAGYSGSLALVFLSGGGAIANGTQIGMITAPVETGLMTQSVGAAPAMLAGSTSLPPATTGTQRIDDVMTGALGTLSQQSGDYAGSFPSTGIQYIDQIMSGGRPGAMPQASGAQGANQGQSGLGGTGGGGTGGAASLSNGSPLATSGGSSTGSGAQSGSGSLSSGTPSDPSKRGQGSAQ
jgi:hypothetical protein